MRIQRFADAVAGLLLDEDWIAMRSQRAEDYHRWRRETGPMTGINRRSPERTPGVRAFTGERIPYDDGLSIAEDTVELAHRGLRCLVAHMEQIRLSFEEVLPIVTFGRLAAGSGEGVSFSTRIIGTWHEPGCSCAEGSESCEAVDRLG